MMCGCGGQRQQRGDFIKVFHHRAVAREAVHTALRARPSCREEIPTVSSPGDLRQERQSDSPHVPRRSCARSERKFYFLEASPSYRPKRQVE